MEADAEFYGKWLLAAAKANALLQEAMKNACFMKHVDRLMMLPRLAFSPEQIGVAQEPLAHKDIRTTTTHYNRERGIQASRAYSKVLKNNRSSRRKTEGQRNPASVALHKRNSRVGATLSPKWSADDKTANGMRRLS
jgi:hypothetical protein